MHLTRKASASGPVYRLPPDSQVVTFISKPAFRVSQAAPDAFVMERYITLVEDGCRACGDDFLADYRRLTPAPPFLTLPGMYRFVDAAQQKNV